MDANAALDSHATAIARALDAAGLPLTKTAIVSLVYFASVMAPATGLTHQQMAKLFTDIAEELAKMPAEKSDPFANMPVPKVIH